MKIKRAIGIIFLVCLATLIICIIGSKLFRVDLATTDPSNVPLAMWYYAIISVVLLIVCGAVWYFRSSQTIPNAKNGFLFGLIAVIFGFIGDLLAFVPYQNGLNILQKYYTQPYYWTAFILILVACTLVGYLRTKKINGINKYDREIRSHN